MIYFGGLPSLSPNAQTHKQVSFDIKVLGERKHAEKECHKAILTHFPESLSGPSQKR